MSWNLKVFKTFLLFFVAGILFFPILSLADSSSIYCGITSLNGGVQTADGTFFFGTRLGDNPLTAEVFWDDGTSTFDNFPNYNNVWSPPTHTYQSGGTYNVVLDVIDSANGSCSASQQVIVQNPPGVTTADIKCKDADSCSIPYNTSAIISWTTTNAAGCVVSPPGWTGNSGTQSTGNLTFDTTYDLNCSIISESGGSGSDSVTVFVDPPPPTPGSPGSFNLSGSCSAVDSSTNRADLSWGTSANANNYEVYHREWTGGTVRFLGTTTVRTFSDTVNNNVDYYYRVKAINSSGEKIANPDWLFVCPASEEPQPGQAILNVNSSGASGVIITRIQGPSDIGGTTNYSRSYTSNISVQLRAAATAPNGNAFVSWSGCSSTQSPSDCNISVNTGQLKTVAANYSAATSCTDNASIFSTSLPSSVTMNPGETKNFSISMENTGNTRWYHPIVYALTQTTSGININLTSPTSQHCQTYMSWLPVCFGKYPGDVMDWTFNLTAPSSVGVYSFQMRMSHAAGEEYLKPDGTTCPAPSSSVLFGQTLSTTINVVQPDQAPIGYLDAANCDIIGGWTFDPDTPNDSINVEIWDGQKGAGGVLVASGLTTGLRQDVNDAYGITGNHGYTFTTPPSLKNGVNHSVYAYGINSNPSGSDGLLGNSPTSVLCPIVDLKVKKKGESDSSYTDGPLSVSFNSKVTLKWTPANSSSCTASGDWSGSKSTSGGTEDQGPLNQIKSYNFNIACTGISSGQANDSVRVDVGVPSPTASNITVTQPNYCVSGPAATTGWDYSDPSGSPQSAYQVQIDDQGSFATPEWDSGKVFCESCRANSTPQGYLVFNRTYKARVKVWNQNDVSSLWAESGSFKTPNQAYPQVDFTFTPANPQRTQPIQFTDQTVFYDSNPNNRSWSWIFGDGGSSTQQNPVKAYANNGIYNVTLTATDASGQSCPVTKPVNVQEANPIWKEINPGG